MEVIFTHRISQMPLDFIDTTVGLGKLIWVQLLLFQRTNLSRKYTVSLVLASPALVFMHMTSQMSLNLIATIVVFGNLFWVQHQELVNIMHSLCSLQISHGISETVWYEVASSDTLYLKLVIHGSEAYCP